MLHFKMAYKCSVCGNNSNWYIMPLNEKVVSGDIVRSNSRFEIQCKTCGQSYLLSLNMKRIEKRAK